jgi:hypothetical protein
MKNLTNPWAIMTAIWFGWALAGVLKAVIA